MLASWSISKRVAAGFLSSMVVFIGFAGFSWLTTSSVGETFKDYRGATTESIAINNFVEDL
ncbi:MAG: hypothetical protein AAGP08_13555, partial [Pseudomonadota bacterium]